MRIYSDLIEIECPVEERTWLGISDKLKKAKNHQNITRLILVDANEKSLTFDAAFVEAATDPIYPSLATLRRRNINYIDPFVVVNIVATGIRAEIGGFAGDATPISNLLSSMCDYLITNPNTVTASDLYYANKNIVYLEGNLICQLMLGNISIIPENQEKVAVIIENPKEERLLNNVLNALNGIRTVAGINVDPVIITGKFGTSCHYSKYGYSTGCFEDLSALKQALDYAECTGAKAVAIISALDLCNEVRNDYFSGKKMPNPWGAAEAMLTHAVTHLYNCTTAHAPLLTDWQNSGTGTLVDPRDGAELISTAYLCSPVYGLRNSPKPLLWRDQYSYSSELSVENISAVIMPESAIGNIPFFASLDQDIPIILVKDNHTIMNMTVERIGIKLENRKIFKVNNYLEVAGLLAAIKNKIALESLTRPISSLVPIKLL